MTKQQLSDEENLEGHVEGFRQGREKGHKEGFQKGKAEGRAEGILIGRKQGLLTGERRMYPVAFADGEVSGMRQVITSLETKMIDDAGGGLWQEWAFSASVPAYWITALADCYRPTPVKRVELEDENFERSEEDAEESA